MNVDGGGPSRWQHNLAPQDIEVMDRDNINAL